MIKHFVTDSTTYIGHCECVVERLLYRVIWNLNKFKSCIIHTVGMWGVGQPFTDL